MGKTAAPSICNVPSGLTATTDAHAEAHTHINITSNMQRDTSTSRVLTACVLSFTLHDMPTFKDIAVPAEGQAITVKNGALTVPDHPIIPFIEGDGTGPDIWRASVRVFDAAVKKAYKDKRQIAWMEVYAGEKAFKKFSNWLPDATVAALLGEAALIRKGTNSKRIAVAHSKTPWKLSNRAAAETIFKP